MSAKTLVQKILNHFNNRSNPTKPFIVGIDGLGGAGKTTLVNIIEQKLTNQDTKVITFHLDNHIVPRDKRYQTGNEAWYEYYYLQWDIEYLKTSLFERIHDSYENISLLFYDKRTDSSMTKQIKIPSNSIVLIEGIFLQREDWKKYFDFLVFLDCPQEIRHKRVLARDLYIGDYQTRLNKYQNRYWLAEDYYMNTIKPKGNADLVILHHSFSD